jgi:bla regulator protein BlaR1
MMPLPRLNFGVKALWFAIAVAPLAIGAMAAAPMYGQILHASAPLPTFEVATVRPMKNGPPTDRGTSPPGVEHYFFTPKMLIGFAYNLPDFSEARITKGPSWLEETYEVRGKIEDSQYAAIQAMPSAERQKQIQLMVQSLLADRFKLKVHFETQEMPMYALEAAKSGPKLMPARKDMPTRFGVVPHGQELELTSNGYTLDELAALLGRQPEVGGRTVVNKTGLSGSYFLMMRWTGEQPTTAVVQASPSSEGTAPSYFTAIQEQLGLRLVPIKGPVELIVVDHIEQPTEN